MTRHIPFNGDTFIGPEIRRLISRYDIKSIIETGTWSGHTTREFAKMGPMVWTIDSTWDHLFEEFGTRAVIDLEASGNVRTVLGDSSKDLVKIIAVAASPILSDAHSVRSGPILFYLDAHGGGANGSNVNPLLEELDQIAMCVQCWGNCVIVIHDFFVPGKNYGCNGGDWGRGYEHLTYDLIKSRLEAIYPDGHSYHYNEQADGATRGVIYVCPKGS